MSNAARKMDEPGITILRDMTAHDLDDLFRQATSGAADQALGRGVPVTGIDETGRVVSTRVAIRVDEGLPEPQRDLSSAK